jgi:tetratricopeptide (TPR) repeat protein
MLPTHANQASLSAVLKMRYSLSGDERDLLEAVHIGRDVVARCPENDEELGRYLSNHSADLVALYKRQGKATLLIEAIEMGRRAVGISSGHRLRFAQTNLAAGLRARYTAYRRPADLTEAADLTRAAYQGRPQTEPERLTVAANLLEILWESGDSEEAAELGQSLLSDPDLPAEQRPAIAVNVALAVRALGDLGRAVELLSEILRGFDRHHPRWPLVAGNLAHSLTEAGTDPDHAVELAKEAVDRTPPDDRALAWQLQVLALANQAIAERDDDADARENAWRAWRAASTRPDRLLSGFNRPCSRQSGLGRFSQIQDEPVMTTQPRRNCWTSLPGGGWHAPTGRLC